MPATSLPNVKMSGGVEKKSGNFLVGYQARYAVLVGAATRNQLDCLVLYALATDAAPKKVVHVIAAEASRKDGRECGFFVVEDGDATSWYAAPTPAACEKWVRLLNRKPSAADIADAEAAEQAAEDSLAAEAKREEARKAAAKVFRKEAEALEAARREQQKIEDAERLAARKAKKEAQLAVEAEEAEARELAAAAKSKRSSSGAAARAAAKQAVDEDEEEEEEARPKPEAKGRSKPADSDDDDEDEKPKPKPRRKAADDDVD